MLDSADVHEEREMAEGFRQVGHMGLATGMLIGGAAAAYQRGVNRAVAWQSACDAEAIRQDEVGALRRLMSAFKTERARANAENARADGLQAELDRLRLEHVRLLRRQ